MRFSKNQITKAGKTILTSKNELERNNALETINIWRTDHLYPLNTMKNSLNRVVVKHKIEPYLVSQRLKRLVSIEYKLDLNEKMGLGGMQDIGGYRAVLKDTKDLINLKNILVKNRYHKIDRITDYVAEPKNSGYRSIHFVYTFNSKNEIYNGLKVELQIRTKLQHYWATAVETAGIITKTSLKSSQGLDEWLEFFKIVSSLFAIKEKMPVLEEHKKIEVEKLMLECERLAKSMNVIPILSALRVSVKHLEKNNSDYYLLTIDAIKKVVNIRNYKKKDFEKASEDYLQIEKDIKPNECAVVLVSSSSLKSIKKAYPSYFLDTSEFITALSKILENCKKIKRD
jgi:ppGpp synthetase/RelA/SpoT-type nucleotidyltranferase